MRTIRTLRGENMAEYKEISSRLKMLLSKAEEMGWNWDAYIEPDNRRTYVEIGQASPAGEDFSMIIDFKEKDQAKSLEDWKANGEIAWCPHCIGYVQVYDEDSEKCPVCGTELED